MTVAAAAAGKTFDTQPPLPGNLSELLTRHVRDRPGRIAVGTSDLQTVISYRQLDTLVRSAMTQLSSLGLGRGHTIGLLADNSIEFVVALLAIVSSGARVAPLNPALTLPELGKRLSALSAHALLASKQRGERLGNSDPVPGAAAMWIVSIEGSGSASSVHIANGNGHSPESAAVAKTRPPIIDSDVALVMFTAGSTSAPKAVPLTHRNLLASIQSIAGWYDLSPSDATLIVMPLSHGHGLVAGLLATLLSGGGAYVPSTGGFSAHLFWPDVVRLGVTWYTAVPTIHRILLNRAPQEYPHSSAIALRFIRSCSAPLDEGLAAAISATFRAPVISAYGMTEASHQVSSNPLPAHGPNKTSSVGLPTGVELRIVADDGTDVPSGGVGEIWVRGATVIAGYLDNPDANSTSFVDGWFRSGDLGSRDVDGYLSIEGRIKEIINRGGEKISPHEIDAILQSYPKVLEAASFGEPDAVYGENVQAAVILRPGMDATEVELQDYCRSKLSSFEIPKSIHIVAEFPRTAKGSIDLRALAAQFATRS